MTDPNLTPPRLSVVVPVFNEQDNVAPLAREIIAALHRVVPFEIVYVDDCSSDDTLTALRTLKADTAELRVICHLVNAGQSSAIRNGVKAARGTWIATLDGDGQNDPADITKLLAARDRSPAGPRVTGTLESGVNSIESRLRGLRRRSSAC